MSLVLHRYKDEEAPIITLEKSSYHSSVQSSTRHSKTPYERRRVSNRLSIHATVFSKISEYAQADLVDLLYPRTMLCLHSLRLTESLLYFREFLATISKTAKLPETVTSTPDAIIIGNNNLELTNRPLYAFVDFQSVQLGMRLPDRTVICGKNAIECPFEDRSRSQISICKDSLIYTRKSKLIFNSRENPFLESTTCLVKRLINMETEYFTKHPKIDVLLLLDIRY